MTRILFAALVFFSTSAVLGSPQPDVIYGEDNRRDVFEVDNSAYLRATDSTVALVRANRMGPIQGEWTRILGESFRATYDLCPSERFGDQKVSAFCSGSLVADDIIMTAGHCITNEARCRDTKFVFGFAVTSRDHDPNSVRTSDVYSCKNLITTKAVSNGADFALIRLDRKVTGHAVLPLNRTGIIREGTDLVVVGHPSGIPAKIADGARVRSSDLSTHFVANLDTYQGNSGSAVFNARSLEIEGILVRGEQDFVFENGCRVSKVCANSDCRGEDVTKISEVIPFLQSEL